MLTGSEFPERVETPRLAVRRFVDADAPRVLSILSRLDVIRWLDNPPFVPMADLDAARAWVVRVNARETEDPLQAWRALEVRETGVMAGTVLVSRMERIDGGFVGEYELGWHLHPDSAGHGYATEGAAAHARSAFAAGHASLVIGMYPDNAPSAAVARRLGAEDLGEVPDDPWYGGVSRHFTLRPEHLDATEVRE